MLEMRFPVHLPEEADGKQPLVHFAVHTASLSLRQLCLETEETPGHIVKQSHLLAQLVS